MVQLVHSIVGDEDTLVDDDTLVDEGTSVDEDASVDDDTLDVEVIYGEDRLSTVWKVNFTA